MDRLKINFLNRKLNTEILHYYYKLRYFANRRKFGIGTEWLIDQKYLKAFNTFIYRLFCKSLKNCME